MTKTNPQSQVPNPGGRRVLADHEARDAIATALDDTLIVEAAAGTGKTTELVNRIVRVIETGRAEVDQIVSVTFTRSCGRAEAQAARGARRITHQSRSSARRNAIGSTTRFDGWKKRKSGTIHGFCADLLRERPVEARVDPLFTVLTEAQARRLYVARVMPGLGTAVESSEGIRRSLRRPVLAGFGVSDTRTARSNGCRTPDGTHRSGAISKATGIVLLRWSGRIDALVKQLRGFADLSTGPAYRYDSFYLDTRPARQLMEDIIHTEKISPRDYNRQEGMLVDLGQEPRHSARAQRQRKVLSPQRSGRTSRARREELQAEAGPLRGRARTRTSLCCCARLPPVRTEYGTRKAEAGALDFLGSALKAARSGRDDGRCDGAFSSASGGCSWTSFRTPIRCRRKSCCCSPRTIRTHHWRASARFRASSSSWAIPSSRSIASGVPMSESPRRVRDARRGGREAGHAATSFARGPTSSATINASIEPDDGELGLVPGQLRAARTVPG